MLKAAGGAALAVARAKALAQDAVKSDGAGSTTSNRGEEEEGHANCTTRIG